MPQPFSVHSGVQLEKDLGSWDANGNITIPGNITAANHPTSVVGSVTAADSTITVGGTSTAPTVGVNAIPESKVTGLTADLAALAPLASPALTGTATASNLTVSGTLKAAGALICTSSTQPSSVQAGQIIFETDTGLFARWDGSAWRYFSADGSVSTIYRASASSGQSIPTATDTLVAFGTDNKTTALCTKATSGAGHKFTINKAGIWTVTAQVRWPTASAGQMFSAIQLNGGPIFGQGALSSSVAPNTQNSFVCQDFAVNDVITLDVFQNSGGSLTLDTTSVGVHINLAWIHG